MSAESSEAPASELSNATRAEAALLAVLPRAVRAHAVVRHDGARVIVNDRPLEVKWAMDGGLGPVRRIIAGADKPDVLVARQFSPGAKVAMADAGVGWVDELGAAEISIGPIVVSRTGSPAGDRKQNVRWTRSALAVAEAILCGIQATSHAVADACGLSLGSSVNALRLLTDLGLLRAERPRGPASGREVVDRDQLLSVYAAQAQALAVDLRLEVGVVWRDHAVGMHEVGVSWEVSGLRYAVTGGAAADLIAPHLTTVPRLEVYVGGDTQLGMEVAADVAGLRPVPGGRLILRPFPTTATLTLSKRVGGVLVAPWPRIYVDLLHAGIRGEDAAEHLKETVRGG